MRYRILLSILGGVILGILTGLAVPELGILGGILGSVFGIVFAYVSSNVTAIVGSSSNPISGMVIAFLIVVSLIFKFLGINSMAGDIIQDLKTGHIVGANPKKQFIGEFIGIFTAYLFITWVAYMVSDHKTSLPLRVSS